MIKSTLDYRLDQAEKRRWNCIEDYEFTQVLHTYIHLLMEVYTSPSSTKVNHLDYHYLKDIWHHVWDITNHLYKEHYE